MTTFKSRVNLMVGVAGIHMSISAVLALYKVYLRLSKPSSSSSRAEDAALSLSDPEMSTQAACLRSIKEARDEVTSHMPLLTAVAIGSHLSGRSLGMQSPGVRAVLLVYVVRALARLCCTPSQVRKCVGIANVGEYGILGYWIAGLLGFIEN